MGGVEANSMCPKRYMYTQQSLRGDGAGKVFSSAQYEKTQYNSK